jgi:transcription-repair coupling factor (superfamily II helicase)
MPTAPSTSSLTLRALLKGAARRAGLLERASAFSGLSPAARAFAVAVVSGESPAVLVVPTDRDVDQAVGDARFFVGALEGLSDADVERAVLPFPSPEVDPYRGLAPHFDVASARARALHALAARSARLIVASAAALLPRMSGPQRLLSASRVIRPGDDLSPRELAALLADAGYLPADPVEAHGEYARRGGVVDYFPAGDVQPVRVEFVGDTVEEIRRFDPATQRSTSALDQAAVVPLRELFESAPPVPDAEWDRSATFFDYVAVRGGVRLFVSEAETAAEAGLAKELQVLASHGDAVARGQAAPAPDTLIVPWRDVAAALAPAVRLEQLEVLEPDSFEASPSAALPPGLAGPSPGMPGAAGGRHVACQPALEYRGRLRDWAADIRQARQRGETVVFVAASPGRAERIGEILREYELVALAVDRAEALEGASVLVTVGRLSRGFRLPDAGLALYAETDVFEEERAASHRRAPTRAFLSDFRDLKVGDLVVHVDHGIGRFVGLKEIAVGDERHEFMELRYAGDDKLFVPVERLDLVQKYLGGAAPALDRLGGVTWEKAKSRVKKAMRDMADELLRLYAARKAVAGHAFSPDTHWQEEFEAAFEFELTPDQEAAIADVKRDMEAPTPMDRLLCGDVGYGKTEVAMRAAFKAVMDGKQVAVLAPTTVLALQHLKTFRTRFAAFPMSIDMVSRFRSPAEQRAVLERLAAGQLDIVIGTHRLLSKDVVFRDLGLLVVDEEQRFGVTHKERIKQLRKKVDVLTLTATPIPRTLNMSLVGIRDMSIIETPPRDRLSIQTHVVKFDPQVIASAIRHELGRGGQVYFVHNRVESIPSMASLLARLVPEARIAVGHGQMSEAALERVMVQFVNHEHDVLLATTIIENGLDIPNANTLIVNRADRYGLAQLYQLRGRVGRSDRRAYAYLLIPPEQALSPVARKRLAAIKEFSDLGSGFRVAALDLEIRGAGNLLGGQQSGHIEAVGFEMYMKLLEQTVRELKGEELEDEARATVNLKVELRIDEAYIGDMNQRLGVYRKVAQARSEAEVARVLDEVRDRYGPLPPSVEALAAYAQIRIMADRLRIESVDREGQAVVLRFRNDAPIDPARLVRFLERRRDVRRYPPAVLKLDLAPAATAGAGRSPGDGGARLGGPPGGPSVSWWTARARAGRVAPGFSKQEILKPAAEDPLAPGGVFERVASLLQELEALAGGSVRPGRTGDPGRPATV